jgi:7,8-dihydro-6-hydroxymethylpterin-pyrophosphokinase
MLSFVFNLVMLLTIGFGLLACLESIEYTSRRKQLRKKKQQYLDIDIYDGLRREHRKSRNV